MVSMEFWIVFDTSEGGTNGVDSMPEPALYAALQQ
jgi:hypothetical protein